MTDAAVRPGTAGRLKLILLLGMLEAFGPLSMDLYMPVLPELARSLETSDTLAQASMSVCMMGLGLGQLLMGPLSDRYGRKKPLLVGVALFAVFSLACALAPGIELLLVARALQGLAGAAGVVIALAIARDLFSGIELSKMLSMLALVGASAPVIAPVLGGQLARFMDWRGIFAVLAGIGVLLLLAAMALGETLAPERRSRGGAASTVGDYARVAKDRLFIALLLTSTLGGIGFFSYLSMSSFVVQNQFGLTPQVFSVVFAANALANMGGAQVSRLLVGRFGPAATYLAGYGATGFMAVALLAAALLGTAPGVFLGLLAGYLMAAGISGPNTTTLALDGHGQRAGTAAALFGMGSFAVGPVVAPLAAWGGATTMSMAIAIASAVGLATILAFCLVRPRLVARGLLDSRAPREAKEKQTT
ncbi:multidrug effflux MFS transporter [Paeniglutamicibacter sp. R2-26]|uniref:multidrug effflux MFS transporter n=1 Tax=Paeniglutamicibacter sp. R2-26 TaxID=3144417 RepID=UPI003EE804EC